VGDALAGKAAILSDAGFEFNAFCVEMAGAVRASSGAAASLEFFRREATKGVKTQRTAPNGGDGFASHFGKNAGMADTLDRRYYGGAVRISGTLSF
jgi:hypothetical protein